MNELFQIEKDILDRYLMFIVAPVYGNEISAMELKVPNQGLDIRVEEYATFTKIDVAFGEVRHLDCRSRLPFGEFGIATAIGFFQQYTKEECGVPGYDFSGIGYRINAVGGKGRTDTGHDFYIQTEDILKYLISFREICRSQTVHKRDLTSGLWDTAEIGW